MLTATCTGAHCVNACSDPREKPSTPSVVRLQNKMLKGRAPMLYDKDAYERQTGGRWDMCQTDPYKGSRAIPGSSPFTAKRPTVTRLATPEARNLSAAMYGQYAQ